jgi:acetyl esterase/lipase
MVSHTRILLMIAGIIAISSVALCDMAMAAPPEKDTTLVADAKSEPAKPAVDVQKDIVYGKGGEEDLLLDLAVPRGLNQPTPAIVWIHGGAWRGGHKGEFEKPIIESAEKGYVAVSINYRLVPKHVFPAQIEDCKCAVRWLRANAERLHVDPKRIGVVGGSAGAHLAMMLGAMGSEDGLEGDGGSAGQSSRVAAVVSYAGPTNLASEFPIASKKLVADFLVGYTETAVGARAASPITYVTKDDPPMFLVQGTKDPLVPHDQAYQMVEALTKAGVPARVELLVGQGHGWPKEHARVMRETYEFLAEHLKSSNP